jgi:pimeloyl-ACP methyl ester carboxylesterase
MIDRAQEHTRRSLLAASAVAGLGLTAPANGASADTPAGGGSDAIRPFRCNVPEAAVADLRRRLLATRWPSRETAPDLSQGIQLATLQDLVGYWGSGYDWRRGEAELNRHAQYVTTLDGLDIHFIHVRSRHADALPLIVTHGWPGSVFEQLKIIGPLTDPTAHGGQAADAFHVVIPSLPGYGFSGQPTAAGWGPEHVARTWGALMTRLGYRRYVAQGGDWGSPITSEMARQKAPGLQAIHINLPATVPADVAKAVADGGPPPDGLSPQERAVFEALARGAQSGARAYFTMMSARPQAIGYGVTDSPSGLAAWILLHPGFTQWLQRDGDPAKKYLTRDDVLDDITLYWLTNSGASSGRLYWENGGRSPTAAAAWKTTEIALPVAISIFKEDSYRPPESWARRAYPSLSYFHEVEKGGHFAAWEQPVLFSAELRAAFRPLRHAA